MSTTTLVLGVSLKPQRYSNIAVKRLVQNNHHVIAVGLTPGMIDGVEVIDFESAFAHALPASSRDEPLGRTADSQKSQVDTVTLYIHPSRQPQYYTYVVSLRPRRVIFNPGTENPEFYRILKEEGIQSEVACTLVLLATNQYETQEGT